MKKIRLSAPDWCFLEKSGLVPEAYYREVRRIGFEAVEMVSPGNMAAARAAGLEIINQSGPGMTKGLNRTENHAEILPQIRTAIADAQREGIPNVIVFSGNRAGQPDSVGIENCLAGLRQVVGDAEKAKVTLLFEMLNSHDHVDYQADNSKYGFEIARKLASPFLKVLYDVYHMERMGEDAAREIVGNLKLITHIHVAESPARTIPVMDGTIQYRKILKAVREAGYDGFWGMEFVPGNDVMKEVEEAFRRFAE